MSSEEMKLRGRHYWRREIAAAALAGLMFRDGTSKSKAGQAAAAIEYAEELLAQLEAKEGPELAELAEV